MTILEYSPSEAELLDFLNDRIRDLQAAGFEARFILAGSTAYRRLRAAMGNRFGRTPGKFETYQYIPIVVDPSRSDTVCVLPAPSDCAESAKIYRMED